MKKEQWKDIKGYEGLYKASNLGRINSLARKISYGNGGCRVVKERIMKPGQSRGYYKVCLCKNEKQKKFLVSRLVALAFIPNLDNKPEVNHIKPVKSNNHASNLEWVTKKGNTAEAVRLDLYECGEQHYKSKLTNQQAKEIRDSTDSNVKTAKKYGVTHGTVGLIKRRKTWKHL